MAIARASDPGAEEPSATTLAAWEEHAACKGRTRLFFAPRAERPQARARREAQARRLCTACPVRDACRSFAREHHEYGFWGGESEEDRHLAGFTVAAPIWVRARGHRPVMVADGREETARSA